MRDHVLENCAITGAKRKPCVADCSGEEKLNVPPSRMRETMEIPEEAGCIPGHTTQLQTSEKESIAGLPRGGDNVYA